MTNGLLRAGVKQLATYDLQAGNLWVIVLIATLVSPWLAARMRGYV